MLCLIYFPVITGERAKLKPSEVENLSLKWVWHFEEPKNLIASWYHSFALFYRPLFLCFTKVKVEDTLQVISGTSIQHSLLKIVTLTHPPPASIFECPIFSTPSLLKGLIFGTYRSCKQRWFQLVLMNTHELETAGSFVRGCRMH